MSKFNISSKKHFQISITYINMHPLNLN